jgi:hypothetical protein
MNGYHIEQRNEITLDQPEGYEAPQPGQCYCHLTMHCHHPHHCHFCEAEVAREFIAWCEADDREDQLREQRQGDLALEYDFEFSPLDVIEIREFFERPCSPRTERNAA